jgi:uncharacterized pyridoxal phosphate-containing UPF0001 family protein
MSVAEKIARIYEEIRTAAARAGRDPDEITLMAVSKTFAAERIREAYRAGIRHFGENRVQEFAGKVDSLRDLGDVNLGGEAAKSGVPPDSPELDRLLSAAPEFGHLEIRGLMTVPPFTENPHQARPFFCKLRALRDQIAGRKLSAVRMEVLSMGMSHDFEVAIEEGSTCVRLGTAIFGDRTVEL